LILRRLHLRRFLGLPDAAYDFAPGINVIIGPNEAGKSTLRTAIRTVLYENPATTSPKSRDQFRTWGVDDPPELVLEFELNGRRFTLTKNYATRKVVLGDAAGQTWEQHKSVQERVVAALGLPTDDLFDATAHIAQTHLERIHVTSIGKELGRIIGGGGEDVTTALRRLETHIKALERGSRTVAVKEPGQLVALERKVAALREEVDALRRNAAQADRSRVELTAVSAARVQLAEQFGAKKTLLESNQETLRDEERLAALKREEAMWEQKVRDIGDLGKRLAALDRDLEQATARGVPADAPTRQARTLSERLQARERDLEVVRHELETPETGRRPPVAAWVLVMVSAILVGLGLLARGTWGPVASMLIVAGIAAMAAGGILISRAARAAQLAVLRREERERREQALENELRQVGVQLDAALAALGCASVAEAEDRVRGYRDLVRERQQVAEFVQRLREGSDDEALAERWKTVRRDVFGLEERLRAPEVTAKRMTPLQVQGLEREVGDLEGQLTQAQRREMKITVDLERLTTDSEELAAKDEQLAEADEALAMIRRHHEVCTEALAVLTEARRLAEVPLREVVEKRAGEFLAAATEGRYKRLAVEPETLSLSVWSDEAGGWIEAAEPHLSRGTVDLVYLAARLALVTVLTGGRRPPLLFDDPFITFDDRRRAGALALLRELSRDHQVFLFTYTRHYDQFADRLIELPDRTALQAAPAGIPAPVTAPSATPEPTAPSPVGPLWEPHPH